MRILELIHDVDHPEVSNLDYWVATHPGWRTRKVRAYQTKEWPDAESFDLLVVHGGVQHLWDKVSDPWLETELGFVRRVLHLNRPVLGFCLGSQLLAEALGGRVFKAETSEVGWWYVQLREETKSHPLLCKLDEGLVTFLWHADHYSLPPGCVSLAFTAAAPNQIIVSSAFPAVGFQFHPEYTKSIIRTFFEALEPELISRETGFDSKEAFFADLKKHPETYPLFEKLMDNALEWFNLKRPDVDG